MKCLSATEVQPHGVLIKGLEGEIGAPYLWQSEISLFKERLACARAHARSYGHEDELPITFGQQQGRSNVINENMHMLCFNLFFVSENVKIRRFLQFS